MSQAIKILIIGNGFGGIYTLKNIHKSFHRNHNIKLTLVGKKNYFLFTPLLHEVATGGINAKNIIEPVQQILGCCLDEFYLGKAEMINLKDQTVKVGENLIPYDYLVLAPGSETAFFNTKGAEEFSFPLKDISDAVKIKNHCVTQIEKASHVKDSELRKKMLRFVVVGGGPTGVELVAELEEFVKETFAHYYSKEIINDVSVILMQRDKELVPMFHPKIRQKSLKALTKKGINVMLNCAVKEIDSSFVVFNANEKIFTETVIWVAGVSPSKINFDENVEQVNNKLVVNEYLQLKNYPNVFAIGDVSLFTQKNKENVDIPVPALAQVAEKEAKIVAKNIELLVKNKKLEKFFYESSGTLLSLGQWNAAGEISHFTFSGRIAWWIWRTVYLSKIISFRKKVRVALDWTINLFSPRDISQL